MRIRQRTGKKGGALWYLSAGFLLALILIIAGNKTTRYTSSDRYCASCHVHPQATRTWKLSSHADNRYGVKVHCVECHLPPHGKGYLKEKMKTGSRDLLSKWFKDTENINWSERSRPETAVRHTYKSSCIRCHPNLFPKGLSRKGEDAHLHYDSHQDELHCINCHIAVGHYDTGAIHAANVSFGTGREARGEVYVRPAEVHGFENFTETVPVTTVSFDMVAIPGGTFLMGSPSDEPFRNQDEGPQRKVTVSSFFMGKYEVSWDEFLAFYRETATQGKTADAYLNTVRNKPDAISGPTSPWGDPGQGWGKGSRPAITMTWHAANVYCQWLSQKTGKKYRLPTEAEWEYAARGGTSGPYFFEGSPKQYMKKGLMKKIFGTDTSVIGRFVIYRENSNGMTHPPEGMKENPFGLVNILGNVGEFCSDWYGDKTFAAYPDGGITDPAGPETGTEHVIRGGSFRSPAPDVRCAARDHTHTESWLKTDPQIPKSIWWYSDCYWVGFRVVCDYDEKEENKNN